MGQLYEIHTLYNDGQLANEWDTCDLHTQLTSLSDSIASGCSRDIGPLSEQDQGLDDLRATSHLTLNIILARLKLIQVFGPNSPICVGELKKFWPREDAEGLEERIMFLRSELEVTVSSLQTYVPKPFAQPVDLYKVTTVLVAQPRDNPRGSSLLGHYPRQKSTQRTLLAGSKTRGEREVLKAQHCDTL